MPHNLPILLALVAVASIVITEWLRHRSYLKYRGSGFIPGTQHIAMIGTFVAAAFLFSAAVVGVVGIASNLPWPVLAFGIAVVVLALPTLWLVMYLLTPLWKYERCPKCHKRKLVMCWAVRSNPPSPAFYKCLACGTRYSRKFGNWLDASGPEYDDKYANRNLG